MSKVDKALEVGSSFDWITPMFSLFMSRSHETCRVPQEYINHVDAAASELGIKVRNGSIIHGDYVFDVKKGEWDKMRRWMGW